MSTRLDLPPIARRLNERLLASKQAYRTDDDTAAMVGDLRSLIVDAVTELENDVIINNNRSHSAATQSIGLATPSTSEAGTTWRAGIEEGLES
ncbi:hypothetical protein [Gordonia amicalis]|uniref:hypothetical protein n=1 Tax=Gordonia amicalis TaxID=89053 RepID=UPI0002A65C38|nr:hypothetical protein [Gordonia amicalis]MBA5849656.1 hypothetical protein [Gordonia amicalis]MDV7173814.1 hypothetical protein [Gordonia amicalis]NKX76812.1 hypothetical protein [Gordonia amicalis]UKO90865.1 hypothetical protein IHQ52_17875 [Gordonia amicalis]UOG22376.1 hypothetical protein MTX80_04925 [Gordonia amicalis]